MPPEKKQTIKQWVTWIGTFIGVGSIIFAGGGFVSEQKSKIDKIQEWQANHEKTDTDFKHDVYNSLLKLEVSTAKISQSVDDIKEVGKREMQYHRETLNSLKTLHNER